VTAAASTVEALAYSLRGGVDALSRIDVLERLYQLDDQQLRDIVARLLARKFDYAGLADLTIQVSRISGMNVALSGEIHPRKTSTFIGGRRRWPHRWRSSCTAAIVPAAIAQVMANFCQQLAWASDYQDSCTAGSSILRPCLSLRASAVARLPTIR
jgi:hypothetical protein